MRQPKNYEKVATVMVLAAATACTANAAQIIPSWLPGVINVTI